MYISNLILKNFRNYSDLSVDFSPGINFITGNNGTGKTNILEAVSILANLKSFRNINDQDIIQWNEHAYYCKAELEDHDYHSFEIGFSNVNNTVKKKIKLDGLVKNSTADYYGKMLVVIFSPTDLNLISGPPDIRRRFIDSIISKINILYLKELTEFKKILKSRNNVLKKIRESVKPDYGELDVWDALIAEKITYLKKERTVFIQTMDSKFKDNYLNISGENGTPGITHNSSIECSEKESIINELLSVRKRDILFGYSNKGPHRDDYVLQNDDMVRFENYGSQGQKRTAAIALKKAELEIIEESTGQRVIIMVDDILSELDYKRRDNMVRLLHGGNQVLFTMVDANSITMSDFNNYKSFIMQSYGNLVEE